MKDQPDNWIRCYWIIVIALFIILSFILIKEGFGQIEPGPIVKPTPIPKTTPTPAPETAEEWSSVIEKSPTAEKFVTKKSVVATGDVAQYPTEKIIQDPLSASAVKGVRWVKTYRLWTRGDGTVIPLSNGWTAETILDAPVSVVTKPTVEVFK